MENFIIYADDNEEQLGHFEQNNQHLSLEVTIVKAPVSNTNLRDELLNDHIITSDNTYKLTDLAFAQAHISLWKEAVQKQSAITIFEANAITHTDFIKHQEQSLTLYPNYDLMIWGYNLNWNPCLQLLPCLPKAIYTFNGNSKEELQIANNNLIDVPTYQQNDLVTVQTMKAFSFSGIGCYTISPKAAEHLLQKMLPIGKESAPSYQDTPYGSNFYVFNPVKHRENISLDIEINRHIEELNTYLTVPILAALPTNNQP